MSKTYTIPQAKHSSGIHFRPHLQQKFLQYDIKFDRTSIYQFHNEDQYDINKLFGLSFGLHHTNSVRFGWRSLGNYSSKIEILAYCYVNGERVIEEHDNLYIAMIDLNKFYRFRINVGENDYTLTIFDHLHNIGSITIPHRDLPFWGYHLYPYFGGNRKAPQDINIIFKN
jgi:hypothetical protein